MGCLLRAALLISLIVFGAIGANAAVKFGTPKVGAFGSKGSGGGGGGFVPPPPSCILVDTGNCILVDTGNKLLEHN